MDAGKYILSKTYLRAPEAVAPLFLPLVRLAAAARDLRPGSSVGRIGALRAANKVIVETRRPHWNDAILFGLLVLENIHQTLARLGSLGGFVLHL